MASSLRCPPSSGSSGNDVDDGALKASSPCRRRSIFLSLAVRHAGAGRSAPGSARAVGALLLLVMNLIGLLVLAPTFVGAVSDWVPSNPSR